MTALSAKGRKSLPKTSFAIPGTRSYPIDTPARARSALARVAASGTPAQQAKVKTAVRKRYPAMAVAGKKGSATRARRK